MPWDLSGAQLFNVRANASVLTVAGQQDRWEHGALLNVPSYSQFKLTTTAKADKLCFMVGIIPVGSNLAQEDSYKHVGYHIFAKNMSLYAQDGTFAAPGLAHRGAMGSQPLHLSFVPNPPRLSFALGDSELVDVTARFKEGHIAAADYRPCILMRDTGTQVRIEVLDLDAANAADAALLDARGALGKVPATMWEQRLFTDGVVRCGEQSFPVHRAVLSAISPVFRAAFMPDHFAEGSAATVEIGEAQPDTVHALLHFFYTAELAPGADVAKLLPLAHRYEMPSLIAICAETLLSTLDAENVVRISRAMRFFRGHGAVAAVWRRFMRIVGEDDTLIEAMALAT